MNKKLIPPLIFIALALLLYTPTIRGGFVLDDHQLIEENPRIKHAGLLLRSFFSDIYPDLNPQKGHYFRPLTQATFLLNYTLGHLNPSGYHLVNILLHGLNSYLAFLLIGLLFRNRVLSLTTGFLFLIHPIQVSAVAFISGRADLLAVFFMLGALLCALHYLAAKDKRLLAGALLCCAAALLSRETALLTPFLFLVVALTRRPKNDASTKYLALGMFALAASYITLRLSIFTEERLAHLLISRMTPARELLNFVNILGQYAALIVKPWPLSPMHTTPVISSPTAGVTAFLILGGLLLVLVVRDLKRKNFVLPFGFFWAAISLLPVIKTMHGLPRMGLVMAEHWLYLPSIGIFLMIGALLNRFPKAAVWLLAGLCAAALPFTVSYGRIWQSDASIYSRLREQHGPDTVLPQDAPWIVHNETGNMYRRQQRWAEALDEYQKSIGLNPKNYVSVLNTALVYMAQNRMNESHRALMRALAMNPEYEQVHLGLGQWHLLRNDLEKAQPAFENAVYFNPDNPNAYLGLAVVFLGQQRNREAIEILRYAERRTRLGPDQWRSFGAAYANAGDREDAGQCLIKSGRQNKKVPRDGIEPPTQGFSVPRSTD